MTAADLVQALRRASLDLPLSHPDQSAIQAAHEALMRAPSISGQTVVQFRPRSDNPPPSAA